MLFRCLLNRTCTLFEHYGLVHLRNTIMTNKVPIDSETMYTTRSKRTLFCENGGGTFERLIKAIVDSFMVRTKCQFNYSSLGGTQKQIKQKKIII